MDFNKFNISSYLPTMPYVVRELFDKATNIVMNYTETETKVVEATNDESWGPAGKLLQELSQLTFSNEHYNELIGMLWKRCFTQDKRCWRRTYKSLLVLSYLIKNGSERVIRSAREHLYDLKSLDDFSYHDENGKDQGINIRLKAKELVEFIQDDDRVRDERKKAKANREKYVGVSHEASSFRHGDRWDDTDESKTKDFDGRWKSKTVDDFSKVKDFVSEDYSFDKSSGVDQNMKLTKKKDQNKMQSSKTSSSIENLSSTQNKKPSSTIKVPEVDLLGEDIDFTPYVQASQDEEFGQFQEAISPSPSVQSTLWPSSTQSSSSSTAFDPFAPFESSPNLFQPTLFPSNQQLFTNASIFSQQSAIQPTTQTKSNTIWSIGEGKLDISLNNLIPHTRGNQEKKNLTLNQLTSPTKSTDLDFTSLNTNTQSIFSSKK
ncbi:unnamed protein product [Rotaria magnacalcarata]|uniref:ENTH domain-containing protein n=2 Tax=Rotaria magnacalcarata TaxID=392030 RepID=A0A816GIV0_9BILA|nr:unnamed protein product [Rotaria magnacalcarata]CAF1675875.1 unnamed protein product [Rotaria magnacalcarata]CAF2020139.1 unnamed protein product [Rotaria magnacalcarata]